MCLILTHQRRITHQLTQFANGGILSTSRGVGGSEAVAFCLGSAYIKITVRKESIIATIGALTLFDPWVSSPWRSSLRRWAVVGLLPPPSLHLHYHRYQYYHDLQCYAFVLFSLPRYVTWCGGLLIIIVTDFWEENTISIYEMSIELAGRQRQV